MVHKKISMFYKKTKIESTWVLVEIDFEWFSDWAVQNNKTENPICAFCFEFFIGT